MSDPKIDIVMFNMSCYTEWQTGFANRNFHVLHNLIQHSGVRKIVAVDNLPFTWRRVLKMWLQNIFGGVKGKVLARGWFYKLVALSEAEIEKTGYKLEGYAPSDVPYKIFIYTDIRSMWSEAKVYKQLQIELAQLDIKQPVIWSYLPTFINYFDVFGKSIKIFEAVDNWLEHSAYKKIIERLRFNYQTIRYKADLIFTTAPALVDFFDRGRDCVYIPNGVSLIHIDNAAKIIGRDMAGLPRPIVGYYGVMTKDRLDVDLIAYLARENPNKSLVMIGWVWPNLKTIIQQKLKPFTNIYWLGRKSYREALAYLRGFDVAIVPHLQNEFNRFTDPLKIYEYLAAGKPVVSTPANNLPGFKQLIYSANTPEEFNNCLRTAISETNTTLIKERRALAEANAWPVRINEMWQRLEPYLVKNYERP